MIKAMLRVETFHDLNLTAATSYGVLGVGHSGPIQTVINRLIPTQQNYWIPTLNKLGIPHNLNSLDGNPIGVMDQPSNVDPEHYTRSYSANGYLPHAKKNLVVMTSTRVSKIEMTKAANGTLVASGVTLEDGTCITASKEVILSAGTIQSPGLLELSGIGQPAVLAAAGVPLLLALPGVGENLQDHLRVQSSYQLHPNYTSFDFLRSNTTFVNQQMALYNESKPSEYDYTGSGYTYMNWLQALGNDSQLISLAEAASDGSPVDKKKLEYLTTKDGSSVPQLEVIFSDGYTGTKGYPLANSTLYGKGFFTLISAVMHTFSKGSIHINSSSIENKPVINPNYCSNDYDIQALTEAAKYNRKIAQTYPMSQAWIDEYEPGLDVVTNDAQWREYVLNTTVSIYHPLGTCAMMPREDGGVVDTSLMVYGTANLRVVDASIIPIQPSAHIQTAVYGIAEMATDIIVKAWKP